MAMLEKMAWEQTLVVCELLNPPFWRRSWGEKKNVNCLHLTCDILCNRLNRMGTVLLVSLAEPLKSENGLTQVVLQTAPGHAAWYEGMALRLRTPATYGIMERLRYPELLMLAGADTLHANSSDAVDNMVCRALDFARELLLQEITYIEWYHQCLPGRLCGCTAA